MEKSEDRRIPAEGTSRPECGNTERRGTRVFRGFDALPRFVRPVVTVGSYDGVHLGHRALIDRLTAEARAVGGESVVLTFDPHPRITLERGLKRAGHEVMLLQSDDLDAVVAAANDWPADIFVSLHCNASPGRNARGTETLYYSEQGRLLGEAVQKKILSKVPTIDRGCKERQGLYVLRRTVMTAILVELAFIDNNDDLELLENDMPAFAGAIAAGIDEYFRQAEI